MNEPVHRRQKSLLIMKKLKIEVAIFNLCCIDAI
jgi:hypothetical protein